MLTADVFLYPREGNAALLAALTEAQQECSRRLWTEKCPLSLLADKAHDIPVEEQQEDT